jgi:DNA-directed RNA polymerase delta subunit
LGEGLGHSIPPQVSSVARKPLSIAFEEIAADKIVKIDRLPYDEMEQEAAEIFGEFVTENVDDSESADEFASAVTEEAVTEVDDVRDDASTADADES